MKKPQYITLFVAIALLGLLWAFGKTKSESHSHDVHEGHQHEAPAQQASETLATSSFSIDSALTATRQKLSGQEAATVDKLAAEATKSKDKEAEIHAYHQLSEFWKTTVRAFIPYAWYTAEGARLENSEKNLNFAGHLFLTNLHNVESEELVRWMALQANDLFERSLKVNPDNDSAKVGLGATYLFGGISNAPMQGIAKIREVLDKDSTNIYAQMTLVSGSLMSGQTQKAKERLETVIKIDPKNLQAILLLADLFEKEENKQEALKYYQRALPLVSDHQEMKAELEKRIDALK